MGGFFTAQGTENFGTRKYTEPHAGTHGNELEVTMASPCRNEDAVALTVIMVTGYVASQTEPEPCVLLVLVS